MGCGKLLSRGARSALVPSTGRDAEASEVRRAVLEGVVMGFSPSCGGTAVFREAELGRVVGACVERAEARCWWAT
jgi:hypothetical protein